jgi:serine/threonine protein kinase
MTVLEAPSGTLREEMWLGGRFRLDERIGVSERIGGRGVTSEQADGLSLWKATDQLLGRPVTIYLLSPGRTVPPHLIKAVQAAAKVNDPRLATIYDTDFGAECPYIVSEWTPGTHLEDLVLSGLPSPALAAAMIADAADALAVAHQAGLPHLRLTPRSLRWDHHSGLKITGLGLDAAWYGPDAGDALVADPVLADTRALARMLYALLTGYWPGGEGTALPPAPGHKGQVCTPRQVRAGVPALLDAITYRALRGEAPDAPARPLTPAGLALELHGVRRPSFGIIDPPEDNAAREHRRHARHARARAGVLHRTTLLRSA